MSYVAVCKALYDYDAQDPETELSFKEEQVIYIVDKEDDDQWWKAKLKVGEDATETDDKIGLVPVNYIEEVLPASHSRALYAYEATSEDELTITEDQILEVYEEAEEWNLVRIHGDTSSRIGFVPANYTEALVPGEAESMGLLTGAGDQTAGHTHNDGSADVQEVEGDAREVAAQSTSYVDPVAERAAAASAKAKQDPVQTWSLSELDGKKKKKGTLGVGNGAVFFASESDKAPVRQYPITNLQSYSSSSKQLDLIFASGETMSLVCSSKDMSTEIVDKLEASKRVAGGSPLRSTEREVGGLDQGVVDDSSETPASPPAAAKGVRWAEQQSYMPPPPSHPSRGNSSASIPTAAATAAAAAVRSANVLYDFDAQGDDELSVKEGEVVTVIDSDSEDWWTVKNSAGQQGVVPAQYVEMAEGGGDVANQAAVDAAAARAAEDARVEADQAEQARKDAIARAAEEAREREEEERLRAEHERAKRERRERRRQEEERRAKEEAAARRREQVRLEPPPEPPKLKQRPSATDVAEATRNLPSGKGRRQPERPQGDSASGKARPNPSRTRTWHDKTGNFRVEAEFLGMGNGKIRLHKLNGVVIEVPLEKMSIEDINYIKRKSRQARQEAEDDVPLARIAGPVSSSSADHPSAESRARASPAPPVVTVSQPAAAAQPQQQQRRRPKFDWFEFFLSAGCDMDDCSRYAANFDRDRIDESILSELDAGTLRSLGLREGDVIRVKKAIEVKFRKLSPEQQEQIKIDEEYARKLQEYESNGGRGTPPVPPPNLFTSSDGKLANNTRRGRPERKGTVSTVDADGIAAASEKLTRQPSPPLLAPSPPPAPKEQATLISGFDDDAWVPKPSTPTPAVPSPPPPPALPTAVTAPKPQQNANTLSNQLNGLSMQSTGAQPQPNSTDDLLARIAAYKPTQQQQQQQQPQQQQQQQQEAPSGYNQGLGMGGSQQGMGQLLNTQSTGFQGLSPQATASSDGPRSPLAPVPSNQGLLNPLVPTNTGFQGFVPTRQSPMQPAATGFQPQMQAQPTGMYNQPMQPSESQRRAFVIFANVPTTVMTGYNPAMQNPNSMFNAVANVPTQQMQPQQTGAADRFAPSSIFSAMKRGDAGPAQQESQGPQSAQKYDALRPMPTGAPMMPSMTGQPMMPAMTGYNGMMMPNQTGQQQMWGQQQPMYGQPTGYGYQQAPGGFYRQ